MQRKVLKEFGMFGFAFVLNSVLLGIALAADAFSVSLANGLNEPKMRRKKMCLIAGVFGCFQAIMPLIGYLCVRTIVNIFSYFEKLIPWIALALLGFIGGKMLIDGIKNRGGESETPAVGFAALLVQGIATSIDALSVGFTMAEYRPVEAVVSALIIAVVTFILCIFGLLIGRKVGTKLSGVASILGGCILIAIGLEIFIKGIL